MLRNKVVQESSALSFDQIQEAFTKIRDSVKFQEKTQGKILSYRTSIEYMRSYIKNVIYLMSMGKEINFVASEMVK